jgi:2-polyprenyl-3-methyl-5-hydroxy-6-metoxy-1,4-benzoquinol methylase
VPDPWRISHARFRDKVLRRSTSRFIAGKTILELGCGEGHLTQAIFSDASSVTGIDLSDVAIGRARNRGLPNARFEHSGFLRTSFKGYDVIAAIECLYYLTPEDQETFFERVAREHRGILIISGPIIGANEHRKYFTHDCLLETFSRHSMSLVKSNNLNVYRKRSKLAALLMRFPFGSQLLDYLPGHLIYQRCYIMRMM